MREDGISRYIVEEDDGGHHMPVDVEVRGRCTHLTSKFFSIEDHGNGWVYRSGGREIQLTYADVADIVNSVLVLHSHGNSIHSCRIFKQSAGLENSRNRKVKKGDKQ